MISSNRGQRYNKIFKLQNKSAFISNFGKQIKAPPDQCQAMPLNSVAYDSDYIFQTCPLRLSGHQPQGIVIITLHIPHFKSLLQRSQILLMQMIILHLKEDISQSYQCPRHNQVYPMRSHGIRHHIDDNQRESQLQHHVYQ